MILFASGFAPVAANKTPLVIGGTANIRPRILRYDWSDAANPTTDQGIEVKVRRCTALGTSTAYTLQGVDPSDDAATFVVTAGINCTVEPTYVGFLVDRSFNPRMTHQWLAYSPDEELIIPAVASNGIGFQTQTAGGAGAGNLLINASVRQ